MSKTVLKMPVTAGGEGGGEVAASARSHLLSPTSPVITFCNPAVVAAFSEAVERGDNRAVKELLGKYSDLANSSLSNDDEPLSAAIAKDYSEICEYLLAAGAKTNYLIRDGFRPLHKAATHGNVAIVNLLLAFGADVDAIVCENLTVADCSAGEVIHVIDAFTALPEEGRKKWGEEIREEALRKFKSGVGLAAPRAERAIERAGREK
jgi:hypothetical protein